METSLIRSGVRSFLVAFFAILGIFFAFVVFALLGGLMSGHISPTPETRYKLEIAPNANGVRKVVSASAPVILKIDIKGVIGTEFLNSDTVGQQLIESREGVLASDRVKGLLLNINSPGGGVTDSDGIYRAIRSYRERYKVPVFAYIDGMCASGGLYIAVGANKIYASDVSIVGSVGVLTGPFFNVKEALNKLSIDSLMVSAGKGKTELNPFQKWAPDESASLQKLVDSFYDDFVQIVASERPQLTKEALVKDLGAHVFSAEEAAKIGYIDGSGYSYKTTLEALLKEANITDEEYQVIEMKSKNWLSEFVNGKRTVLSLLTGPTLLDTRLRGQPLYIYP
jgi:signal peptide peptidase SppA